MELTTGYRARAPVRHGGGRVTGTVLVAAVALGACGLGGFFGESQTAKACAQVFSAARCLAMTDEAASQLHVTREDIAALEVLPEPDDNLQVRSGGPPIDVRVTLGDGSVHRVTMPCAGIPSSPSCFDEPRLQISSPSEGGYFDHPEGASPVPTAAPDALAAASSLRIDRLDIPIDHVGRFEVRLGEAALPNGLLTTATFDLVDPWPAGVTIIEGGVRLEVRSLVDGRILWNVFEHGWRDGTEPVEAVLIFDVFRFDPGAVLAIRSVVVE
jgi:hypothetical protein